MANLELDLDQPQTTIISSSVRAPSSTSRKMHFHVNLVREHFEILNLKENCYAELTTRDGLYTLKFSPKETVRSRKVSANKKNGETVGATVSFPVEHFKLPHMKIPAYDIAAEYIENGLTFEFDREEFVKPRVNSVLETKKITSTEDKVLYGFKPDTAWGIALQEKVDAAIEARIQKSMSYKFSDAEEIVEPVIITETPRIDYGMISHGYQSITQKGVK